MGILDTVKNLFTEEVEVEEKEPKKQKKPKKKEKRVRREEPQEEIQKEVIQVEIPSPKEAKEEYKDYEEDNTNEPEEEEYKFPFFDDDDFDVVTVEEKPKEEPKKAYQKEMYNPPKEEKKIFKPSPIISPVYGFLDKNYQKEELTNKKNEYTTKRASVDEIRDRAYGSLESDIETTLFGSNRVLFDEKNKTAELEKIEEEKPIDKDEGFDSKILEEKPRHENIKEDDDLTDLLEAEMAKPDKEDKKSKKPRKISDKELFSLIDSMYEGEIK